MNPATLCSLAASAFVAANSKVDTCDKFDAFVIDKDSMGLNFRDAPNAKGRILGQLGFECTVVVTKSSGMWLYVEADKDSEDCFDSMDENLKPIPYKGPTKGWVYAPLLGTNIENNGIPVFQSAQSRSHGYRLSEQYSVPLQSCAGKRVQLLLHEKPQKTGWVDGKYLCGNPHSNCSIWFKELGPFN
ncbi:MAG: hypothetical protein A2289_05055 [Deltaproteobacteria bacterium RIFOXYA12_FULL_58_15]|nr:MAG: hypothetical protein A2289_05055 [Deltaproteobacteria bacterium RIFOXYA12_FULL_58_15]OGR09389.1 MAG: hypothetical protein A2341_18035 [Deltaproteobacteria bacterium RIFOXYB12_FULL_58_9]